ncbi:hypothetical protein KAH94_00365 [bacterium]|nr:hypothetical protein [bacterium]
MLVFNAVPNRKNLCILFFAAFLVRAATFQFYVQYNQRYKQPDSMDYHNCAISMTMGTGMHRPDNLQPIFWRTPGYPTFIHFFYKLFRIKSTKFAPNSAAHKAILWTQITLSSFLPLLLFFLILALTGVLSLAWIVAWIFVFHIGTVFASTYLLTEALSLLLFFPFLLFFYKSFSVWGEKKQSSFVLNTIIAALCLGIMTWIRPMGEFVSILATILIVVLGNALWKQKIKQIALFFIIFFLVTGGWYLRNYNITGKIFFCPMFGPYLNSFCAPKIIRDTTKYTLAQCINGQYKKAIHEAKIDDLLAKRKGKRGCKELSALKVALPVIKKHPWMFARDWIKEVLKTTFDLHSSLLVAFANNTFTYDPLEEFLTEKWQACLYKQPMSYGMRFFIFLELLFEILKWIGILLGAWLFLAVPLIKRSTISKARKKITLLWLKVAPVIGAIVFMTGGFGYARLRLPVEPLMVLLSLTWYFWVFKKRK